ncbi:unnamed protein product [Brachionus calyciflorus]|uniref:Transmembrane protein 144 n=1 Tax=Brachionus calyciflorus TaxID=104777 RepID=A0A813M5L0_9BILA|nr:unnamed protein product [Brachionus calyciflorus]
MNDNSTSNSTTLPTYSGFLFLVGSSFFYGSNYLPVKQYETGDGMFFQLILCIAIWTVGFIVNCIRKFPTFYPLPLFGGFLWATGNVNTVVIIQTIGIGLGMLFWGSLGLITGWATARFGLFGLDANEPSNQVLNYIGIFLALISAVFYLFVKSETKKENTIEVEESTNSTQVLIGRDQSDKSFFEKLSPIKKRIIGIGLACISGILYGQCNTPVLLTTQSHESKNYLDYMFSYYTGILLTSLGYFIIYCIYKKNQPSIYPEIILPGLVSGWMWGAANVCYFLATNALSQAISFPISNCGPPIVASLWGILLYKEIKGKKNFLILGVGFSVAIIASVLIGLSS